LPDTTLDSRSACGNLARQDIREPANVPAAMIFLPGDEIRLQNLLLQYTGRQFSLIVSRIAPVVDAFEVAK
jgi:hypothetical protein